MLLFIASSIALAQDPTVASQADGTVVATVKVAESPEQVRAVLSDADVVSRLAPEVLDVSSVPKGDCVVVDVTTEGAWNPLVYKALRCPTANGWTTDLIQSDDFDDIDISWTVTPNGTGSAIEYRVKTDLSMPLPAKLLQGHMEKSARATLVRLLERIRLAR